MACLGAREIVSQKPVGSRICLVPGRGCSDGHTLWVVGSVGTSVKRSLVG